MKTRASISQFIHTILLSTSLAGPLAGATVSTCDEAALRSAVEAGGVVALDCTGTLVLSSPLAVADTVVIDATGHDVVLSGGAVTRLFDVKPGATLTLIHLTLVDGLALGKSSLDLPGAAGEAGDGGAILNRGGSVVASGCQFRRNRALGGTGGPADVSGLGGGPGLGGAGRGGAVFNADGGTFAAIDCQFADNKVAGGEGGSSLSPGVRGRSGPSLGGAIYNGPGGLVTFTNSQFVRNEAAGLPAGGALFSRLGRVMLSRCVVAGNKAILNTAQGGALYVEGGETTLEQMTFDRNSALGGDFSPAQGGAVCLNDGLLTVANSYFHDNRAVGSSESFCRFCPPAGTGQGGALAVLAGSARIDHSTLAGNTAVGGSGAQVINGRAEGGALYNRGTLELQNVTIANNEARAPSEPNLRAGSASGGGLFNAEGTATLTHVTIANNAARGLAAGSVIPGSVVAGESQGGGACNAAGVMVLRNCIVANSPSGTNCFGPMIDGGGNISSDGSAALTAADSQNETEPRLSPLLDFGGRAPSMAPLSGSPAINAASASSCLPTDQRGRARPYGPACDSGAFESSPPYAVFGKIFGSRVRPGVSVSADGTATVTDNQNEFVLRINEPASYEVVPAASRFFFHPTNRLVNFLSNPADVVGLSFRAYELNSLEIELLENRQYRVTYAGTAGHTVILQTTTHLAEPAGWQPLVTHAVPADGVFRIDDTATAQPTRFYRALTLE